MQAHPHFRFRPSCEVCGCQSKTVVLSRDFSDRAVMGFLETYYAGTIDAGFLQGARYEIARCDRCSFHWQHAILTDNGLSTLYTRWIDAGESREKRQRSDSSVYKAYAREMGHISAFIGKPPRDTRVLDHGMGWGHWCRMALAFGFDAYGTELSEERRSSAERMGVKVVDIENLPSDAFDFINSEQSFEHIPDPIANIKKLTRALRPGGVVRIAVPDAAPAIPLLKSKNWKAAKDAFHPLEHINAFTHSTLARLGAEAGLKPVRRPTFPVFASNLKALIGGLVAPLLRERNGTTLYFAKP